MKNWSIQTKLFFSINILFIILILSFSWFFASWQNSKDELAYRERLKSFAETSAIMIHSAAEEYAQSINLRYHHTAVGDTKDNSELGKLEQEATAMFLADPKIKFFERKIIKDGVPWMYVFVPGLVKEECNICHGSFNITVLEKIKIGEIGAVFDISGSMQTILDQKFKTLWVTIIFSLIVIVLMNLVVGFFLQRVIIKPLQAVILSAEVISKGDLTTVVSVNSNDEVGKLGLAFNSMIEHLSETIKEVKEVSLSVANASSKILSSTGQMAVGAQEQTAQATEVASASEEMTRTINENSRNASLSAETAKGSKLIAEEGGKVVEETVKNMKRIAEMVKKSAVRLQDLGKSSNQIGDIINVIDDIADQTNLLALNASIEAARAGEQGRGFAVVANEVGKLAERTMVATKEIAGMIKKIQNETNIAVSFMEQGNKQVDEGIQSADKAGESLKKIIGASNKVTDMVTQIAAANEEQSNASEEIAKNVESISTVTGETAEEIQEIAQTAEALKKLTDNLHQLIEKFKV